MHKDLEQSFTKMIELLKKDPRCKGGWHYGSVSRGTQDEYSDYDPVFLVGAKDFEEFALDVPELLKKVSDELLIFWGEGFNDGCFKNYCSVIRIGENLHQLDFFIINEGFPEAWMCRQHAKDCHQENIIYDVSGEIKEFLNKGYTTDNNIPDTIRAIDTYWFHAEMLIKYFKRGDIFKLIKNMDVMFHAHVDLLLSQYDTLNWGAWESKVKHCVPVDKQQHLLGYFNQATIPDMKKTVLAMMDLFQEDVEEIIKAKGLEYSESIGRQIKNYFVKSV